MHEEILTPETRSVWDRLTDWCARRNLYLAGGTGCALHLGHRISRDLDFFTPDAVDPGEIQRSLSAIGRAIADHTATGTWVGRFEEVKVGFFRYSYALVEPLHFFQGKKVASLADIGGMKIEAISGRGRKRDFVDLAFILKSGPGMGLRRILDVHRLKCGEDNVNLVHALKSLAYFEDADPDPDPDMLVPFSWEDTKSFLRDEVRRLAG